jgi:hypothetical protein
MPTGIPINRAMITAVKIRARVSIVSAQSPIPSITNIPISVKTANPLPEMYQASKANSGIIT